MIDNPLMFRGMKVFISNVLPYWGTQPGPMKLSPRVTVSDQFRKDIDAWMRDFFGDKHYPQPVFVEIIQGQLPALRFEDVAVLFPDGVTPPRYPGEDVFYVSPRVYRQLRDNPDLVRNFSNFSL